MCSMRQGADLKAKWARSVRACRTRPLEATRRHICEATDDNRRRLLYGISPTARGCKTRQTTRPRGNDYHQFPL